MSRNKARVTFDLSRGVLYRFELKKKLFRTFIFLLFISFMGYIFLNSIPKIPLKINLVVIHEEIIQKIKISSFLLLLAFLVSWVRLTLTVVNYYSKKTEYLLSWIVPKYEICEQFNRFKYYYHVLNIRSVYPEAFSFLPALC